MRKVLKINFIVLLIFFVSGCGLFGPREKEFNTEKISITLTSEFKEIENKQFYLVLSSNDHVFMANPESKDMLEGAGYNNLTLEGYTSLVLSVNGKTTIVEKYNDNDVSFCYAYYTSTVDGVTYMYMLVTMIGVKDYYTMNFSCVEKNFNSEVKEQYIDWAKTIKVA